MEYRPIRPEEYEAVRLFMAEMGWESRVSDPAKFQKMMERADRTVVVFDGDRVIGFGRALCDDVSNGYISMVAVAPDKRGQGIGRELVKRLVGDDPGLTWVLRARRDSKGFWQKLGFTVSEIAMERTRARV